MELPPASAVESWSSLIEHEFKDIFQENNHSFDSKKQCFNAFKSPIKKTFMPNKADTTCLWSRMQNMFSYLDFLSIVEPPVSNHTKWEGSVVAYRRWSLMKVGQQGWNF